MTGYPHPQVLTNLMQVMMTEEDICQAIIKVNEQKKVKGISLGTLISSLAKELVGYDIPQSMLGLLF